MFAFLKPQSAVQDDPLQSPAIAFAWLRTLPPQDAAARQRQVLAVLADARRLGESLDRDRIAAIAFIGAATETDAHRLVMQYASSVDRSPNVAECVLQSMIEMNEAFIATYRVALEAALARPRSAWSQSLIPLLLARLIRGFGIDGRMHAFRYERWIPARWRALHLLYRQAQERGCERTQLPPNGLESSARPLTVEQEYLCVLLDHRIDTGNLSPAEFAEVSERLREWSGELALDTVPHSGAFVVDIEGKTGLARWTGAQCGATLRFVDTAPLAARIQHEIAVLERPRLASSAIEERERQRRIATLHKVWPAVATTPASALRRQPREPSTEQVVARIGLAQVYNAIAAAKVDASPRDGQHTETAHGYGSNKTQKTRPSDQDVGWVVVDRSATGLRLRAQRGTRQAVTVGSLMALRSVAENVWTLGAVRRVCRMSCDVVEVGVSLLADRVVAATVHGLCAARADMSFVVNGIDMSAMGAIFRGLHIASTAQPTSFPAHGTLIIPTSNHDVGRRVLLTAGDDVHSLVLREAIEQHADWTWTTVEATPRLLH